MKLVVFGATGSVGRHVVRQAVEAGHVVTTFARHDGAFEGVARSLCGDVLNRQDVVEAVRGQDAVIIVLGDGGKGRVRTRGTANIIATMKECGVRRLVCQSTLGAGDSAGNLNFFWKYIMFGLLLRRAYRDHQLQEELVKRSGLDWTIVRPAAFTDGPATDDVRTGFGADAKGLTLKVSRADVARFLLAAVSDAGWIGKTPGLSY